MKILPTNAFEVMDAAIYDMEEEAARVHMDYWLLDSEDVLIMSEIPNKPPCGIVGCAAGWIVMNGSKMGQHIRLSGKIRFGFSPFSTPMEAEKILGARDENHQPVNRQLSDRLSQFFLNFQRSLYQPGSKEYTAEVIAEMRGIQAEFADYLKSVPVSL